MVACVLISGIFTAKLIKWFEDKRGLVARKAKNLAQADSPSLPSYATQPVSSAVSSSPALQSNVRTVSTASTTTSYWHAVPHREASHTQLLPVSTLLPEMMGTEQRGSFIDDRKIQPAPAQEEIDDFEDEIDDFEEEWESLQQMLDGQDPPLTYEFHILQNPTAGENNQQNVETTVPYYTQL
ncbi:hypothetical protein ACH42_00740 [Endozoicomonas sp. (ex Bugula neritina AB1)]|nr:hypothetical protein ACH42_00740 [Endozoicomonas sp. (ex Bugula neritina AB1)]